MRTPNEIAIDLVDEMQLSLSNNDIDFADNESDIVCSKIAVKFAIEQNKKAGLLTGLYDRVLTELNNLTTNGECRCGNPLPGVKEDETPFEFCSAKCKVEAAAPDLLDACEEAKTIIHNLYNNLEKRDGIELQAILDKAILKAKGE